LRVLLEGFSDCEELVGNQRRWWDWCL